MTMRHHSRRDAGFSLIEMMITITIIGILTAISIPAYTTFVKNTRLLAAEVSLTNALKGFSVANGYSPGSDMLADLVVAGDLNTIPADPWAAPATGPNASDANAVDWYYVNDGDQLYLYAKSHPGRLYILPSFGLPPLSTPATTASTTPAATPATPAATPATPSTTPGTPATPATPSTGKTNNGKALGKTKGKAKGKAN